MQSLFPLPIFCYRGETVIHDKIRCIHGMQGPLALRFQACFREKDVYALLPGVCDKVLPFFSFFL